MTTFRCAIVLTIIAGLAGCGTAGRVDVYTCEDPCDNGQPGWTCDDPCKSCDGQCVPLPPLGFEGPALLWIGEEANSPMCPPETPMTAYEGYADPQDSYVCPRCRCGAPSCQLPYGVETSTSMTCEGPDFAPFTPPQRWDGACFSQPTVPASELNSLRIPPPTVGPCTPIIESTPRPRDLRSTWKTFARACQAEPILNACDNPGRTCVPAINSNSAEYMTCIFFAGAFESDCPTDYPEKYVYYQGLEDTRDCTACECGPPENSACVAQVSTYEDQNCSDLLSLETVTPAGPKCVGGPGTPLGSVRAEWVDNDAGSCKPGGGLRTGALTPTRPATFCCLPSAPAAPK